LKNKYKYKNIRPQSWDTYSKLNGGKRNPIGVSFGFIMDKEIIKGNGKGFGKAQGIYWHSIYENKGKKEGER